MSSNRNRLNPSNPFFWGLIGAIVGLIAALGGEDNRFADGIFGALIQFLLWYGISWLIIRRREKLRKRESSDSESSSLSQTKKSASTSNRMPLVVWFLIAYSIPLVGGIVGRFNTAQSWSQISGESQISIVFDEVMTLAGIIDTFVFPSLASAITITTSIFYYRKTALKLKQNSKKPLLVSLFVLTTLAIWVLLSFTLAYVVAA